MATDDPDCSPQPPSATGGDPAARDESLPAEPAPEELAPQDQAEDESDAWEPPPAQPLRFVLALGLIGAGAALYGFVLTSFWSSGDLGIHDRIPYPAYVLIVLALLTALAGLRLSFGIWSPHAKLGIGILGFFTCVALGIGGGRFASYTLRGTLNPEFNLHLAHGDQFPDFALKDQHGAIHTLHDSTAPLTLIVVYRGDFCPFARFQLAELTSRAPELAAAKINVLAISTDPIERSRKLAAFIGTAIPLLSDQSESILAPMGLVQHHRNAEPDNAIPADFLVDSNGFVKWTFVSPYYREVPRLETILAAARSITGAR
jgi:peroxiredoxin